MKAMSFAVLLFVATPVAAETLTPCDGSYDGPGMTACALLGSAGTVGMPTVFWNVYEKNPTPLYVITDYAATNVLTQLPDGLGYQREHGGLSFTSFSSPFQFAYWPTAEGFIVGIEDLTSDDPMGTDNDFNDYVVQFRHRPLTLRCDVSVDDEAMCAPETHTTVPEPTTLLLMGATFAAMARKLRR